MEIAAYLKRIGCQGPHKPTADILRRLHRAHLLAVPFENLDIHLYRPIVLSLPALYEKIVRRRRGGFCYELNGLFAWLLGQLGFRVNLLSARVFTQGKPGPEFDHLALRVDLEEPWVADVGFGDSFLEPLQLNVQTQDVQQGNAYRLIESGSDRALQRMREGGDWEPQYIFSLAPRRLEEFGAMCHHHQTSPASSFTRKTVCSLATEDGRITLSNDRLIVTTPGSRQEREVVDEQEYRSLLLARFGIRLEADAPIGRLMSPTS